ncbi:maleylpyruvate isomerase N-terminal domain-containing protein [Paenibacillus sp. JTLBN-2024]
MNTKQEKLEAFAGLIRFAESLERLSEEQWAGPIAEGKWSPRDIISHMMLWDRYFLENALRPMSGASADDAEAARFQRVQPRRRGLRADPSKQGI